MGYGVWSLLEGESSSSARKNSFRPSIANFALSEPRVKGSGTGFRDQGSGSRVQDSDPEPGVMVQGAGFKVRVQDSGA